MHETARCVVPVPDPWSRTIAGHYWVILHDDTASLLDTQRCTSQPLPHFSRAAGDAGFEGILVSPHAARIGIVRGMCESVDVYDTATMTIVKTDRTGPFHANAKGCDASALSDAGAVTWVGRGICFFGTPTIFIAGDVGVTDDGNGGFAIKRGMARNPDCASVGLDETFDKKLKTTTLARVTADALPFADGWVRGATSSVVLMGGTSRALLIAWTTRSGTLDRTSPPTVRELFP